MNYNDYMCNGSERVYGDYLIADDKGQIILAACFDRSKIKVQSILMSMMGSRVTRFKNRDFKRIPDEKYEYSIKTAQMGYDRVNYGVIIAGSVNERYLLTDAEHQQEDMYSFLMNNYTAPMLAQWTQYVKETLLKNNKLKCVMWRTYTADESRTLRLHNKDILLKDIIVYEANFTQEDLEEVLSEGLKSKAICITDKEVAELDFKDFNSYLQKYGSTLADNLSAQIETLMPLKGQVDSLALKTKRLFPQQAACINGIMALKRAGRRFGLMIEGMGVGKTIQGASVVEGYFAEKYLQSHPEEDLKSMYEKPDALSYRNIVVCPGHLTKKWKAEIEKEIPYAKAEIITSLEDLFAIKQRGKKRSYGREFYIIGKDKAKLGSTLAPIPNKVAKMRPVGKICAACLEGSLEGRYDDALKHRILTKTRPLERHELPFYAKHVPPLSDGTCRECGSSKMKQVYLWLGSEDKQKGMICPHCGELLMKHSPKLVIGAAKDIVAKQVLQPADFAGKTSTNEKCMHCGGVLWGYDCKPSGKHKSPWNVIKFFSTARKDKTKKAIVLKGYEKTFNAAYQYGKPEIMEHEYGIRRYPLERYAKKYLKGYFDFCILDEVHKFEGFSSAQANAAHSFMKCSDFTLGLTGTICNGSASSFFSLLFRLNPSKMRQKGYTFTEGSMMDFAKTYGVVESVFEDDETGSYNKSSRGRMLKTPTVKPGISPLLFVDFLMENSVFLDLSDLSKYLPPLIEKVVTVDLPDDVAMSYRRVNSDLKKVLRTKEGASAMADILQFGLSYPDKPYGRSPILSTKIEDRVLAVPENHEEYLNGKLLPKEEKLVEIVNQELEEGRNCFIYCSFTGKGEMNITGRLQNLVETRCNLKGRVEILRAESPKAEEREEYLHKRAAEGIRVFICNPKVVETGLDFCFEYKGAFYNYPTLIFYQMGYELAVIWQASRRAHRLNQIQECRTYWMCCEGTLQSAALALMAQKQVATSAIQGKFSTEGLATLAKGVDTRVALAQALAEGDMSDRDSIENMFDVMAQGDDGDDMYADYVPPKTYYELLGITPMTADADSDGFFSDFFGSDVLVQAKAEVVKPAPVEKKNEEEAVQMPVSDDIFAMFGMFMSDPVNVTAKAKAKAKEEVSAEKTKATKTTKKAKTKDAQGQMCLFDFAV